MVDYLELFERNLGIFTDEEQLRIRRARILVIGCGGIGSTLAVCLARTGVENFILIDDDDFEPSNMNRQLACTMNTIGKNKAHALGDYLRTINPSIQTIEYDRRLSHREIQQLFQNVDLVFPAADDLAFSLIAFRDAQKEGLTSLIVVPSGTWACVSIISPHSPPVEDLFGLPKLQNYEDLSELMKKVEYKKQTSFYVSHGSWLPEYHKKFIEEENVSPPQLCPSVWMASTIGANEAMKYLSRRWHPITSPKYWMITSNHIRICHLRGLSMTNLTIWKRKIDWLLYQKLNADRPLRHN